MTTRELIEKIKEKDPNGNFVVTYIKGTFLDKDGLPTIQTEVTDIDITQFNDEKQIITLLLK